MVFKIVFLTLAIGFLGEISGKSIQNTKESVWFPNPNNDGSFIEARLTPTAEGIQMGNISDIHFLLYTGDNQQTPDELFFGEKEALANSHYLEGRLLKIIIHGFGGSANDFFPREMCKEYMKLDSNLNIIMVDWSVLADSSNYLAAVANAQLTSRASADLIEFLIAQNVVKREDIHLIGFSLGGQVIGQIGSRVSEKLTRITALDPALPLFDVAHLENRTDPSDAHFVEVIHTAGNGILGYFDPCGTVDWYPNGGRHQPGCGVDLTGSCAHSRAPAFFLESLFTPAGFPGVKCASWDAYQDGLCEDNESALMGHHTPLNITGIFYLTTNAESPYAEGYI